MGLATLSGKVFSQFLIIVEGLDDLLFNCSFFACRRLLLFLLQLLAARCLVMLNELVSYLVSDRGLAAALAA
jgi:hypothetical protein